MLAQVGQVAANVMRGYGIHRLNPILAKVATEGRQLEGVEFNRFGAQLRARRSSRNPYTSRFRLPLFRTIS